MRVSAWNDGGSTYGIRIGRPNRDAHFQRNWTAIEVELDGQVRRLPLSDGFWKNCPEVRSPIIREWLGRHALLKWRKKAPPRFELTPLGGNRFRLFSL